MTTNLMNIRILPAVALAALALLGTASCMDSHDEPDTAQTLVTSPISVGEVNATILDVKQKYCASSETAEFKRNSSNFYSKVNEDVIITGVVVANDVSGNLYQTLLLRNIEADGTDQCIVLGVKNTCLYPYFALGQRIKVNLKGLYAGCYSKVPRIGQPTKSSYGNLNLGPMLFELLPTHVELVGEPNPNAPELAPIDLTDAAGDAWLRASANKTYLNTPLLATVRGNIKEVEPANRNVLDIGTMDEYAGKPESLSAAGKKMFAPYELHDQGYGVDRTIKLQSNTSSVTVRTSTRNEISFMELPEDVRSYTGLVSYYDSWQVQLRDAADISAN